ncbi:MULTISPECIES: BglG family transcription antiterminator [unclassified Luteococcus]|uniref:BglG family transcription antiterminator n=1 Tax=unclassified Luteococcus TaxID=2639923 RepID=UPI00313EBAD2
MPSQPLTPEALVLYLLKQSAHTPAELVAEHFGVSSKTIYRCVQEINAANGEAFVSSQRGKGLMINPTATLHSRSRTPAEVPPGGQLRAHDRRRRILRALLDESPLAIHIDDLCADYQISEPQLRADVHQLQQTVRRYGLQVVRSHHELALVGAEAGVRSALSDMLLVASIGSLTIADTTLEQEGELEDMAFARAQTDFVTELLGCALPSPYDVNLATHLFVLASRARHPHHPGEQQAVAPYRHHHPVDENLWRAAELVRANVERHLGRPVPDVEVDYLYAYLASAHLVGTSPEPDRQDAAESFTRQLAERMGHRCSVHFASPSLVHDLSRHVRPMLNRLRYGLGVTNPVLGQIREAYPDLVQDLGAELHALTRELELASLSDDEVGFIALYFARELELRATPVRALLACASGIGTAELLRVKITRAFPEIDVVEVASASRVPSLLASKAAIDLVVTTVPVELPGDLPVVVVDAMLCEDSQNRVRQALRHVR